MATANNHKVLLTCFGPDADDAPTASDTTSGKIWLYDRSDRPVSSDATAAAPGGGSVALGAGGLVQEWANVAVNLDYSVNGGQVGSFVTDALWANVGSTASPADHVTVDGRDGSYYVAEVVYSPAAGRRRVARFELQVSASVDYETNGDTVTVGGAEVVLVSVLDETIFGTGDVESMVAALIDESTLWRNDDTTGHPTSTALGPGAVASGLNAIAAGVSPDATGSDSIAIGSDAQATGGNAVAAGHDAQAAGVSAVALGNGATVTTGGSAVAIGNGATATGNYSIAMSLSAAASNNQAIALGWNSVGSGLNAVAVGRSPDATGTDSIAIGSDAQATTANSVAIGHDAVADTTGANTAVGQGADASGGSAVAVGVLANASGLYGAALGRNASATASQAVAIGYNVTAATANTTSVNNLEVQGGTLAVNGTANTVITLNLPTSAGATGTLWNDAGTVKVA